MVGFFSKKQYVAIASNELAMKLLNKRCLKYSICAIFFKLSLTVSIKFFSKQYFKARKGSVTHLK